MQDVQNTEISSEYRSVPINILVESATNPRKRFDEKNLEELAASMRAQGILAPLLVRELGHVASEQRSWRNSKPFPSAWSN